MLRTDPRVNWPLHVFSRQNLNKFGANEAFMVKLQLANGVVNTKSTVPKFEEQWDTVNDLLEPLRRYATIISCFDCIYGQALHGLLAVVTRELMYNRADEPKAKEVSRLRLYVELIRTKYGGDQMLSSSIHKFFAYDGVVGEEAQRAQEDLDRTSGKEDREDKRSKRDREKKENRDKPCLDFNSTKGCSYGAERCRFTHKCSGCNGGHAVKDCKKEKP